MDDVERAGLEAELARQRHESAELARVVSETLDLATVGERIAESVLGLLDVYSSAVRLLRPDGMLEAIALSGRAKEYASGQELVAPGAGLVGRAAAEGRPMWTRDFRSDERFSTSEDMRARNAAVGIVAGLAVPLRSAGKVIGVLSVGSPRRRCSGTCAICSGSRA